MLAGWARDVLWALRPPCSIMRASGWSWILSALFTAGISLATGVLFGLTPALRATRANLATDLKERASAPAGFHRMWHPRAVLVMAQVAFSLIALIGAGLFARSLRSAGQIDPGFDAAHLGIVVYNVTDQAYNEGRGREFHARAVEKAAAVHGVISAALARDTPFRVASSRTVLLQGQDHSPAGQGRSTLTSVVSPGYFQTLGISLLRGRDFRMTDTKTTPRVAMVNETAAAAYWPGQDAVGQHISFAGEGLPVEVIGIVKTANYQAIAELPQAMVYLSLVQYYFPTAVLYVRTTGDPEAIAGTVRREVQTLDRNLLLQVESLETSIRELLWAQRLSAGVLAVFGALSAAAGHDRNLRRDLLFGTPADAGNRCPPGAGRHRARCAQDDSAGRSAAGRDRRGVGRRGVAGSGGQRRQHVVHQKPPRCPDIHPGTRCTRGGRCARLLDPCDSRSPYRSLGCVAR